MYDDRLLERMFPFCRGMTASQREVMHKNLKKKYYANETRTTLGLTERVWGVFKGRFSIVMYGEDGKQLRVLSFQQGDCGIGPYLDKEYLLDYCIEVIFEADTEICEIVNPYNGMIPLSALIKFEKDWNRLIMGRLIHQIGRLGLSSLEQRLVELLQEYTVNQQNQTIIITHEKLAEKLGSSREVISRLLMQLSRAGIVELQRKQIRLCKYH